MGQIRERALVGDVHGAAGVVDRVVVVAADAAGGALENLVVVRGRGVDVVEVIRQQLGVGGDAGDADVDGTARLHDADDVSGLDVRVELGVAVAVVGINLRREREGALVVLDEAGCGELRSLLRLGYRGGVRGDGHALAVVVAHRWVGVIVGDEALALGGDVELAVFDISDVNLPLIVRLERRLIARLGVVGVLGSAGAALAHRALVELDVDAEFLLQLRVLELVPRVDRHGDAALRQCVNRGGRAEVILGVTVAVVGVFERLPPDVVLEADVAVAADVGDDELHGDAAGPQRHQAREASDVHVVGASHGTARGEPLAVTESEGAVDGELHVGLDAVDHARLPARGDGETGA